MEADLFDYFRKDLAVQQKLDRMSSVERKLVSMKFLLAMLSDGEDLNVTRHEDQVLKDGRRISILIFEMSVGVFVFGIPQYTDSALVLIDFDLVEEGVFHGFRSQSSLH